MTGMKSCMNPSAGNKGFSIITAIFVLVVLSLLGLAMLTINAVLQTSSSQSTSGVRAYYAAVSGLEWATYQATGRCQDDHDAICPVAATASTPFTVDGFTVTVDCDDAVVSDDGVNNYNLDTLTVTAEKAANAGSPDQVRRILHATVTRGTALPAGVCVTSY